MSKAKKSGSAAKRSTAGKYALRTVKKIAQAARGEIAKVNEQDRQLRVSLGALAITADRLRKQRRFLVRVISALHASCNGATNTGERRMLLSDLDVAPTLGFAIDGDALVIMPPPPEGDPDPGPVDRDVIGALVADDAQAEAQIGEAAEAGADAIMTLGETELEQG